MTEVCNCPKCRKDSLLQEVLYDDDKDILNEKEICKKEKPKNKQLLTEG